MQVHDIARTYGQVPSPIDDVAIAQDALGSEMRMKTQHAGEE